MAKLWFEEDNDLFSEKLTIEDQHCADDPDRIFHERRTGSIESKELSIRVFKISWNDPTDSYRREKGWYLVNYTQPLSKIKFCPFCGQHLPD